MRKISVILFLILFSFPLWSEGKLKVVATLPVLGTIAQEVGGDKVEVAVLAGSAQDPHFIEAKPSFIVKLMSADVFIEAGLDLESAWTVPLLLDSRNRNIQPSEQGYCKTHQNIQIKEIPKGKISRVMGDVHAFGNPHYWMDPINGIIIAKNILTTFKLNDSENSKYYDEQFEKFKAKIKGKTIQWLKQVQPNFGLKVAAYHKEWSYFCDRFRFEVVAYVEPKPGIEPTLIHIKKLNQILNDEKVQFILTAPYNRGVYTPMIEKESNAKVLILPTSTGVVGANTYDQIFEIILREMGLIQ